MLCLFGGEKRDQGIGILGDKKEKDLWCGTVDYGDTPSPVLQYKA